MIADSPRRQRRRGSNSDIIQLVARLGGDAVVIGFYDTRYGVAVTGSGVSQWDDARGASGFGPALVQATDGARPPFDATARTITFDGTADNLRAVSATWGTITDACAVVVVGTGPAGQLGTIRVVADLTDNTPAVAIRSFVPATDNNAAPSANGIDSTPQTVADFVAATGARVLHARRAADGTVGIRLGSETEVTSANTLVATTATKITIGASSVGTPTLFTDFVARAMLVIKGEYPTALQNTVNQWARDAHGAALA
jgi:hypothetical protein